MYDLHIHDNDIEKDMKAEMRFKKAVKRKLKKCAIQTANLRIDFYFAASKSETTSLPANNKYLAYIGYVKQISITALACFIMQCIKNGI